MFCPRCHRELPANFRFCPHDGEQTTESPELGHVRVSPTKMTDALLGRRYVIRGFIGKGAIARVYLAEDQKTGRPVAVKVMEEIHRKDDDARTRFLREARAVTQIGHPNIVEMFEAGIRDEDKAPYLVMEFLFGEPLGRYLEREGTLESQLAIPALRQAASALAAAHQRGIVHRDVKPDNLYLIGEPGDPYELKVLDFGFSRLQTSDLTAAGVVMGTPAFMAPEQVVADEVDARTDVYALGMVMYRMFVGRSPFPASDEVAALAHQLHTVPVRPSKVVPELNRRIEAVIMTATRKDPGRRYPAMDVFFDDLGKLGQPEAKLWAAAPRELATAEDCYQPKTEIGRHVAEALTRTI